MTVTNTEVCQNLLITPSPFVLLVLSLFVLEHPLRCGNLINISSNTQFGVLNTWFFDFLFTPLNFLLCNYNTGYDIG